MALNLIHGVSESLSAGVKAHSLAPGIKKPRAPSCVYGCKDSADSELHVMKPNECQWGVCKLIIILCWRTLPCKQSFG